MSGAFESILLSPSLSKNKMFMETGFLVNGGHDGYNNSATVVSDGATANRAQIQGPFDAVNNPRGWVAGAAVLTWDGVVTVPSVQPTVPLFIHILGDVGAYPWTRSVCNLATYFANASDILSISTGSANWVNLQQFNSTSFRSTYSGQTNRLRVYFVQGTTNPVVLWGDVDISASFTPATAGTPPAWLDAAMVPTYHLTGYNWPAGPAPVGCWILGSLTDADHAFHRSTGQYPAWVVAGGSMRNWLTGDSATFTSSLGSWANYAAGVASLVSNKMRITFNGSNGGASIGLLLTASPVGRKYTLKVTLSGVSATGAALQVGGEFNTKANIALTNGTQYIDFSTEAGVDNFLIYGIGLTGTIDFDDLWLYERGAISLPGIQPCAVVDDLTTIGDNCALLVGMTPVPNRNVERIADYTITSGNEQLMGGSVFRGTSQDYIKSWTIINSGGTTTVSLGNISGGAQYASAVSCPTGTTVITLLSNVPLTTNLWCNANTTAKLLHVIEAYRTV